MGLGGISIWKLVIVLLIVVLIFGTKRLKSIGGDLGGAIKSFREASTGTMTGAATTPKPRERRAGRRVPRAERRSGRA